jgi:hypothetical protein
MLSFVNSMCDSLLDLINLTVKVWKLQEEWVNGETHKCFWN